MKSRLLALLFLILPVSMLLAQTATVRYQNSIRGGLTVAANALELSGSGSTPVYANTAGGVTMSSYSDLVLPAGSTIVKAILYVEGWCDVAAGKLTSTKFRVPGGSYTTLTTASPGFIASTLNSGGSYTQFIIDVTSLMPVNGYVSSVVAGGEASGAGRYAVADVGPLQTDNYGYGWSLVVVYSNSGSKYRSITIADAAVQFGLPAPAGATVDVDVPNVVVPATGTVNAELLLTGCWGESGVGLTDELRFGRNTGILTALADPVTNSSADVMNGSIGFKVPNNVTVDGITGMTTGNYVARNPYNTFVNAGTSGSSYYYDCDIFNANGILAPSPTPITVRLRQTGTASDALSSGTYGISVDIAPCKLTKAISPSTIPCGGTATYTFTIANNEPGAINQTGLGFTDNIPSGLVIASPNGVVVTGGSGGTITATPGTNTFTLSGFSLAAGQTATITLNVTNAAGQYNPSCASNPAAFTNGPTNITGNTSNLGNGVTPQCLAVTAPAVPTFTQIGPLCVGAPSVTLPTSSTDSPAITGTWNTATVTAASAGSTTYTFTPAAGQCANTMTMTVVVNANTTPTFGALANECVGDPAQTLPTTSTNGITGNWNAAPSTAAAGTFSFTFTPTSGTCVTTATTSLTVTANTTPTFAALANVCVGATAPTLPTTSTNGITGNWNAAPSSAAAGTFNFTFTPTSGTCVTTASNTFTVTANTTPTFAALANVCVGATAPTLPTTSTNGITGSWNAAPNTATAGTFNFTFTPTSGTCVTTAGNSLTVTANTTPTFPVMANVCVGATAPILPTTSTNGITGNWNAAPSTAAAGTFNFTFTPTSGTCVTTAGNSLTVAANTTPTFPVLANVCVGATAPILPATSTNGITGNWNAAPSTAAAGTFNFTFTPTSGTCVTTATNSLTVSANTTPTFPVLPSACVGDPAPTLPASSNEGISGNWNAAPSTAVAGTFNFTFTPTSGTCVTTATNTFTVTGNIVPTFAAMANVCEGSTPAPSLPASSNEGVTGSWNAAPTTASPGTFTFTFTPSSGTCQSTATLSLTVDPAATPTFAALANVCQGGTAPTLPATSTNGTTGTWDSAPSTATAGTFTYTFTPSPTECATTATLSLNVTSGVIPTFNPLTAVCVGAAAPTLPTTSTNGVTGTWDAAPSTAAAGTFNFTFTPSAGACATTATISFTVNANPTINAPSLSTCSGVPVTMNASGATSYVWTPNTGLDQDDQPSATATLTADQTYTITGTDVNGCQSTTTATVTIATGLTISVDPSAPTICAGGSVSLTATGAANFTWTGTGVSPATGDTVTASPGSTTTYTVDGNTSGCTGSATVTVTVGPPVTPTFTSIAPLCSGSPAPTLPTSSTNSPAITGTWNATTASTASVGSTTYTFTPAAGECATTASMSITVNAAPIVSGVIETCNATNTQYTVEVTLSGGDPATYNVTGGTGTFAGNVWTSNPIASGTPYNLNFDDASGCGPVNVSGVKNCNCSTSAGTMSGPALTLCQGDVANATHNSNHTLDGNDVLSFVLHSGSGTSLGTVYATSATPTFSYSGALTFGTTYYISAVAGDDNGSGGVVTTDPCLSVAAGTPVIWNPTPVATPNNNGPLCEGQPLNLTTPTVAGGSYDWTGPNNYFIQNPTVASSSVADGGTYTLTVTANGCSSTPVTTTVVINAPVTPTFTALTAVCTGAPAPGLSGSSSEGIPGNWNGAPSSASAGTQTFTFTPSAGQCATTASLSFTVYALPVASAGPDQDVCPGLPATLCGSGGTPVWSGGITDCTPFNPMSTQVYTLTVTDANGCQDTDQATVTVFPVPAITASANPMTACLGESILFNGGGGVAPYLWDNSVTNNVPFTPTTAGTVTYNVGAQDANGCPGTASVTVTIFDLPVVNGGADQTICPGDEVTLAASGAVSYTWDGAVDNVPFSPSSTYNYTVTGTDGNGCQNTDQVIVTVSAPPQADFGVAEFELSVVDPTVTLSNQTIGASIYAWDFGDGTGTSTAVDPTYTYDESIATYTITLTATSAEGCVDQTSHTIVVRDQLIFWVPNSFTPDGDERNNTFQPVFTSGFDPYAFTMVIYNRWGETIFETHDAAIGWDGTYHGTACPTGVYTWAIKGKNPQNDQKFSIEGHVQIIR